MYMYSHKGNLLGGGCAKTCEAVCGRCDARWRGRCRGPAVSWVAWLWPVPCPAGASASRGGAGRPGCPISDDHVYISGVVVWVACRRVSPPGPGGAGIVAARVPKAHGCDRTATTPNKLGTTDHDAQRREQSGPRRKTTRTVRATMENNENSPDHDGKRREQSRRQRKTTRTVRTTTENDENSPDHDGKRREQSGPRW